MVSFIFKIVSAIYFILGVFGSVALFDEIIHLVVSLLALAFSALCVYAIGEILDKLENISRCQEYICRNIKNSDKECGSSEK
ncbi:MAG: hypothetical protein FWE25_08410 [Lachnospiraceae bacterium]|nr:hypothetical protein [Lachnospiraceae bacterium]